jgi:periplasmic divalent cation tolerance protein
MHTNERHPAAADDTARDAGHRDEVIAVYMTFPSESVALEVAEALVGQRLAACVNVVPGIVSFFRWEGAVTREREVVAIAKTTRDRLDALVSVVQGTHPYELPCIVAYGAEGGLVPFLEWVEAETRGG